MKNLEFMYFELPLQSQAIHYGSLAQPYKQRVGGSNPSAPTIENQRLTAM